MRGINHLQDTLSDAVAFLLESDILTSMIASTRSDRDEEDGAGADGDGGGGVASSSMGSGDFLLWLKGAMFRITSKKVLKVGSRKRNCAKA